MTTQTENLLRKMIREEIMKTKNSTVKRLNEENQSSIDWTPLEKFIDKLLKISGTRITHDGGRKPTINTPDLLSKCGIFKLAISRLSVEFFNFSHKDFLWGTIMLSYQSHRGGTNGMNIMTVWNKDGRWTVELDAGDKRYTL